MSFQEKKPRPTLFTRLRSLSFLHYWLTLPSLPNQALTGPLGHSPYVLLPILATTVWFSGLTAVMLLWLGDGKPRYGPKVASIAFISDIGGVNEGLFLSICVVVIM